MNYKHNDNLMNPVIVVVAYNREKSLCRLLNALEHANYEESVPLIISIDYGNNQRVIDIAKSFSWSHGEKKVRVFTENQGCRNHVIQCIDYSIEYGSAIIFEDDILPSPNFYSYVKQSLQCYFKNKKIFAIALHNQLWNGFADSLFVPVRDDFDVYIAQIECSRGECFIGEKWKEFKNWYSQNQELEVKPTIPKVVYDWENSWCKYVLYYIAERNLYYVTPFDSLTTCFPDIGTHTGNGEAKYKFQVPLANGKDDYKLPTFEESTKYDVFFESITLKQYFESKYGKKVIIDCYGTRDSYEDAQLCLSRKKLPYKILEMYGDEMFQPELNCIYNIQGEDIVLYDLEVSAKIVRRNTRKDLIYFGEDFNTIKELANKYLAILQVFNKWILAIHQGACIADYLTKKGIKNIAIYGMGILGKRLFDELYDSDINITCYIDKKSKKDYNGLSVVNIGDIPLEVDCIIVTPVYYYEEIKVNLSSTTSAKIISLEEIVEELANPK